MFTDPISDMLTRIRNAGSARKAEVVLPYSKMKHALANILSNEGFVGAVSTKETGKHKDLVIALKYTKGGDNAIIGIQRVSTPGQRIYAAVNKIPRANGGMGVTILSTSKGLMTDREAYKQKSGGEVICQVW